MYLLTYLAWFFNTLQILCTFITRCLIAFILSLLFSPTPNTTNHYLINNVYFRETDEESESVCAGGAEDEAKEAKRESADRQTTAIKRKTEK